MPDVPISCRRANCELQGFIAFVLDLKEDQAPWGLAVWLAPPFSSCATLSNCWPKCHLETCIYMQCVQKKYTQVRPSERNTNFIQFAHVVCEFQKKWCFLLKKWLFHDKNPGRVLFPNLDRSASETEVKLEDNVSNKSDLVQSKWQFLSRVNGHLCQGWLKHCIHEMGYVWYLPQQSMICWFLILKRYPLCEHVWLDIFLWNLHFRMQFF